ncbi:MAG: hypothetical protein QOI02_991 [Actinomycetota bacterium]|nr:hypothetical protein [Actinomycetota bacterium]
MVLWLCPVALRSGVCAQRNGVNAMLHEPALDSRAFRAVLAQDWLKISTGKVVTSQGGEMAPSKRLTARIAGLMLAGMLAAALTGCGAAPFEKSLTPTGSAIPTPTTTPRAATTVENELANGTTQRDLKAGDINLTVNYFSTLRMDKWTYGANKPLSVSLVGTLGHGGKNKIYLSQVTMATQVLAADGTTLPAVPTVVEDASVSPGYLVKKPYTYSNTFTLPAVDPGAQQIIFTFSYDLLLQSTPKSHTYAKQTATDTLKVAIAN